MDDWRPDTQVTMDAPGKWGGTGGRSDIFFWVIPARVARHVALGSLDGREAPRLRSHARSEVPGGFRRGRVGGRAVKLQEIRLSGEDLSFTFTAEVNGAPVKHEFSGKVEGDTINGSVVVSGARVQGQQEWNARRSGPAGAAAPPAGVPRPLRLAAGVSG